MKYTASILSVVLLLGQSCLVDAGCWKKKKPARTEFPIKNIVITVLENRSFDNVAGFFDHAEDIDGLRNRTHCNWKDPADPTSQQFCSSMDARVKSTYGPSHSLDAISWQIFGQPTDWTKNSSHLGEPDMSGFVAQHHQSAHWSDDNLNQIMSAFDPKKIPVLNTLAEEFVLFDRWFASAPSWTLPNRNFVHSGTAGGCPGAGNFSNVWLYVRGFSQTTMWDKLHEYDYSFTNYFPEVPTFSQFNNLRSPKHWNSYKFFSKFAKDAANGKLPTVSFIDMIYEIFPWAKGTLNDGSAPGDFSRTEEYVKEIYEALRSSPQWENTLWIITFDEHGGFADHVPSPKNVPNPDGGKNGEDGFPYDRLGVRIPTILVSPWLQKGKIVHGDQGTRPSSNSEYEHSSIVASIFKLLGMEKEVGLTDRTKWATTFENLLKERTEPRKDCPLKMPEPYSETPKQKSPKSSANPNNNGSPNIMSRQEYEEIIKSEYLKFPSPNSLQQRSLVGTEGELPTKWNGEPGRIFFDVFQQQVLQKMSSKELKAFITENM